MSAEVTLDRANDAEETDLARLRRRRDHELRALWFELWTLRRIVQQVAWHTPGASSDRAVDQDALRVLTEVRARLSELRLAEATRDALACASMGAAAGDLAA